MSKASEKYQKYVIGIRFSNETYFQALWGTDTEDDDEDKLLLNEEGKILLFDGMSQLREYVLKENDSVFVDHGKLRLWAQELCEENSYAEYNLSRISVLINEETFLWTDLGKEDADSLINFINLYDDYARQSGDKTMIALRRKKDVAMAWEYCYTWFFWRGPDVEKQVYLKEEMADFNFKMFMKNFNEMIVKFEQSCVVLD